MNLLERKAQLQIDTPLVARCLFRAETAGNAGCFVEVRRSQRAIEGVQIGVIQDVARVDRNRDVVTMLGRLTAEAAASASTKAAAASAPSTATAAATRASGNSCKLGCPESPGPADAQVNADVSGAGAAI